ncbi:MAG: phosphotransacetylase family protein [Dehalococcoidia bacterium]|nr:phosphotransacetylase family protein [Dehalococcoidia bacterium]
MTNLLIAAYDPCGKTALCAGIGKKLANSGKRIGYIKPIHVKAEGAGDECLDAAFIGQALELGQGSEELCPIHIKQEQLWHDLSEDAENFSAKIKSACDTAGAGKDVLIIESPGGLKNDQVSTLAAYTIADKLDPRVILLLCWRSDYREAGILQAAEKLGSRLVGVVLNQVPPSKISMVQAECSAYFKEKGIAVLGVLPESRALLGVTVGEIARAVAGEIISFKDKAGDLVENVMLGAMSPDSARDYYNRMRNKAVVTRHERADMQLAALETSTRCLVVSGKRPSASVMIKSEDKKVPVIVVDKDINEIVKGIEQSLAGACFHQAQKLQAMTALLDVRFDYKALNAALG